MKKNILIAILGLFLGLANISLAQVNPNYKLQFPIKKESVESTVIYTIAPDYYQTANNYKSINQSEKVVLISNKPETLPSCCTNVQASVNSDYKHTFYKNKKITCDMGYVCREEAKRSCCN